MTEAFREEEADATLIERVARALARADGCNPDDPAYVRYPGGHAFGLCWRDKYQTKAVAAIEAMREPTEAMLKAAFVAMNATPSGTWKAMKAEGVTPRRLFDVKMAPRFRAMIDAALAVAPVEASPPQTVQPIRDGQP